MPPKKRRRYVHIYILRVLYLFIIIKKRKGRLIKHVLLEIVLAFFLILVFYDFLQLSERGSNEKQVAKKGKKKRTVPTTSAGGQYPPYLPLLSFGFHPSSTFSCIYTYILLLTPPRFHKRRGIEMMGVLYSFSLLDSLSPLIYFYIILL